MMGQLHGAVTRAPSSDMAFALREPGYEVEVSSSWSAPGEKTSAVQWVNALRDKLQPFAHGLYVNALSETSADLIKIGVSVELRSPGRDQEEVRPHECAATQPEHQFGDPLKQLKER
jgi:hypothetical protein